MYCVNLVYWLWQNSYFPHLEQTAAWKCLPISKETMSQVWSGAHIWVVKRGSHLWTAFWVCRVLPPTRSNDDDMKRYQTTAKDLKITIQECRQKHWHTKSCSHRRNKYGQLLPLNLTFVFLLDDWSHFCCMLCQNHEKTLPSKQIMLFFFFFFQNKQKRLKIDRTIRPCVVALF